MTTIDRLIATGALALGAVNLVLLIQNRLRIEYGIEGIHFIARILLGAPV